MIPDENEEILDTLESLLHEIAGEESVSLIDQPTAQEVDEEDVTSALLDSLINGNLAFPSPDVNNLIQQFVFIYFLGDISECQVNDELAEFITLMNTTQVQQIVPVPTIPVVPTVSPMRDDRKSESSDAEWTPRPSGRKPAPVKPSAATLRKPRRKNLKTDDRRLRKKEQNKTAATRYRIKKKAELDILLDEEAELELRNRQLQNQHDELANEVRYLKKLMSEVFGNRKRKWK